MNESAYRYVIVGGGVAGIAAAQGIRAVDAGGSILIVSNEAFRPYDRPPLTKDLWFGKKQVEDISSGEETFFAEQRIELLLETQIVELDAAEKRVRDNKGNTYRFDKLLLATGGAPRTLDIPGGTQDGVFYYRYLRDYLTLRPQATEGTTALVIGGGFIGSEIAAGLHTIGVRVTMLYPDDTLVARVFPEGLGRALQEDYRERGITIVAGDAAAAIERGDRSFITRTRNGQMIGSDLLIVGAGILPSVGLATQAGLTVDNGVVVDTFLRTSHPDIYAAGDNANFPYRALGMRMRIEHWDNSVRQGTQAGRNMAGAGEAYDYMPYFFSDLFEFGYEAVGEVDARLDTFADWQEEMKSGVIYYMRDGIVRGVMLCNVWEKLDAARELIRGGEKVALQDLKGRIG